MLESRTFGGIVFFLFIVNLFIMNDVVSYWSPIELDLLTSKDSTPSILKSCSQFFEGTEFGLRLSSVFSILGGILVLYFLGKKLFGEQDTRISILLLCGSLLVPQLGKTFSGDSILFLLFSIVFLSHLLYLKRPILQWRFLYILVLFLALLFHFVQAFLFAFLLWIGLYLFHPQGKKGIGLMPWLPVLLAAALIYYQSYAWAPEAYWLSYKTIPFGKYILIILAGILPFLPFAVAGLKHNIQKFKRKEELSVIMICLVLAAFFSHSLLFQFAFALMAAKQIKDYDKSNYPHEQSVKITSVLLLLGSFFGMAALMILSYEYLKEPGFRASIIVAIFFWIFNFISVVGVYGKKSQYAFAGMVLSGLLMTFFFWTQFMPVYENKAAVAKQLIYKIEQEKPSFVVYDDAINRQAFEYYAKEKGIKIFPSPGPDSMDSNTIYVGLDKSATIISRLKAWHSLGLDTTYYIQRPISTEHDK